MHALLGLEERERLFLKARIIKKKTEYFYNLNYNIQFCSDPWDSECNNLGFVCLSVLVFRDFLNMLQMRVSHLPCSLMLNIVPGPSTELGSVCLTAKVCAFLKAAYTLPPFFQATPNGPACCWWLLAVLPIDPRYQLSVLSMTTLKERLVKIQHILTYLQSIPNN